jgi:long-chain acyl-CoA synthetase
LEQHQNLKSLIDSALEAYGDRTAVRILRQSDQSGERGLKYVPLTFRQLGEQRDRLATGLAGLGLSKGERVAILTDGGLEPILIFFACDALGLPSVPLCNKLPDDILIHNLKLSEPKVLFADPKSFEQVQRVLPQLDAPPPKIVITEGQAEGAVPFFDLIKSSDPPPEVEVGLDDESKVVFTSGSSGMPKGVVQTHRNILGNCQCIWEAIASSETLDFYKSAPDYHTMGILNIYYPLAKGWSMDLARSPDRVLIDIRHSQPEAFLTVPLILDKVYGGVRKVIDAGGFRGSLVSRSVRAKQRIARGQGSPLDWLIYKGIGKKVIAQIKEKLSSRVGNRLKLLIIGSAKADPEALEFFSEVLDITSYEGYGVTECAPLIAANCLHGVKTGTVGKPFIDVRLVDDANEVIGSGSPSSGTYTSSNGKVGELWASGSHVMKAYLDDPEQTTQALVEEEDGKVWYRTGDLFTIDEEGYLTFSGRVGRQFKLRNGEFVNPERLERLYSAVQLVEHVLVYGDQQRDFPIPIVTISVDEAKLIEDIPDLPKDDDALRAHPAIAERVRSQLLEQATIAGLPSHERPQKIVVVTEPLSEEAGTLTRGLKKVVPKAIAEHYMDQIEAAYAG